MLHIQHSPRASKPPGLSIHPFNSTTPTDTIAYTFPRPGPRYFPFQNTMVAMALVRFLPLIQAICSTGSALVVPEDLPNGVYLFPMDDRGNALGEPTLLRSLADRSLPAQEGTESTLSPRHRGGGGGRQGPPPHPNPKTTCTGQRLNQGACIFARDQFN